MSSRQDAMSMSVKRNRKAQNWGIYIQSVGTLLNGTTHHVSSSSLQNEIITHFVSNPKLGFISRSTFKKFYKRLVIISTNPRRVSPRSKIEFFLLPLQKEFTSTRFRYQTLLGTMFDGGEYIKNSQMKRESPFIIRRVRELEMSPDASQKEKVIR